MNNSIFKTPDENKKDNNELVINYRSHRKILGLMGISLPVTLLIGSIIWDNGHVETAISNYFHTPLRDVFVVTLAAMALFLFSYRGYDAADRWITNIAGFFGLLTAFVSTNFKPEIVTSHYNLVKVIGQGNNPGDYINVPLDVLADGPYRIIPAPITDLQKYFHLTCAALFFLTLAYMCFFQFAKSDQKSRRHLYRTCGGIMFLTILALTPCFLDIAGIRDFYGKYKIIFIGESICMWAFGVAWLVKGIPSKDDVLNSN